MPYEIYETLPEGRKRPCYMVVNSITGKIHAKCTSLPKAQAQLRILGQAEGTEKTVEVGEGILEDAVSAVKSVADRLSFKKRQPGVLPPKSRALLEKVSAEPITSLTVLRTPIESYINKTLQLLSGGQWQNAVRQEGYDKLFHLSLWINKKYLWHKIEVTTLEPSGNPIKPDTQKMDVQLPTTQGYTIGELVQKTKDSMGAERFTNYDPKTENCQDFLLATLKALNLLTPDLEKFIKQDAVAIFNRTPSWTSKIAKFITDLGARTNRLVEGESVKPKTRQPSGWSQALNQWNKQHGGKWYIPKKGSTEYKQVLTLMGKK